MSGKRCEFMEVGDQCCLEAGHYGGHAWKCGVDGCATHNSPFEAQRYPCLSYEKASGGKPGDAMGALMNVVDLPSDDPFPEEGGMPGDTSAHTVVMSFPPGPDKVELPADIKKIDPNFPYVIILKGANDRRVSQNEVSAFRRAWQFVFAGQPAENALIGAEIDLDIYKVMPGSIERVGSSPGPDTTRPPHEVREDGLLKSVLGVSVPGNYSRTITNIWLRAVKEARGDTGRVLALFKSGLSHMADMFLQKEVFKNHDTSKFLEFKRQIDEA